MREFTKLEREALLAKRFSTRVLRARILGLAPGLAGTIVSETTIMGQAVRKSRTAGDQFQVAGRHPALPADDVQE